MSALEEAVEFVKNPPYSGDASFIHKARIKEAGARWSKEGKKWIVDDKTTLLRLLKTGLFFPRNASVQAVSRMIGVVETLIDEESMKAAKVLSDEKLKRERISFEKQEQAKKAKANDARKELNIPPNEEKYMLKVVQHGVTPSMVEESASWNFLGPRSGISDVQRLLRGIKFGIVTFEDVVQGHAAARNSAGARKRTRGM